ncbi:uncharacterized protein UV8b_00779 [Ustilaginoidea virens]|uniref:Kinetochore protein fta7 n=1 Tax=Ustilaginoidea virens TaxID=1159556 RepID=A0A8E5HJN9_USTVR|nr:uncharacterized protein UV8b_00779 [Ustilaginoidea virens]QUC16538.1 hypothetical protein UV8b_00779 [Ustilaginoidea virens]
MAPDPPAKGKRGQPPNASSRPGQSSTIAQHARSRAVTQSSKAGRLQKRDALNTSSTTKRKQSSLRESWTVSSRRDAEEGEEDDEEDEEDEEEEEDDDDDDDDDDDGAGRRAPKRGRVSDAPGRGAGQGGSGVIGRRGVPQPNQPASLGQGKQRANQPQHQSSDRASSPPPPPPPPPKPYVHVAPHTRRVRQSAIEAKWSPLANASLTAVSTTLQHAQRPILQRFSDSQLRRTHTSSALRLVAHRIARKISRGLPFPPASMPANVGRAPLQSDGGREVELNFESVLDGKLSLEKQLEPALDGLEVLRREKDATEAELEHDYAALRNLEAGARSQAREHRSLLKKAHPLTPAPHKQHGPDGRGQPDTTTCPGFRISPDEAAVSGTAFATIKRDDDLHPLAVQLGSHVDSVRANLEQVDGIVPQLASSRAALRAVLLKHLDLRQYEQAILG